MKFTFNTGALYTEAGQIIHVEVADDRIWFHDESRGIAGSVDCPNPHCLQSEREVKEYLMFAYDRCQTRNERMPRAGEARRQREET